MSEWTKLSVLTLPTENKFYIVYGKGFVSIGMTTDMLYSLFENKIFKGLSQITHFMELPELPND